MFHERRGRRWAAIGLVCTGLLVACAPPTRGQQDSSSDQRTPILAFPDLGPIRGTAEPPPLPGSLAPSMDLGGGTAGSGVLGGKRRVGRLPRGGKPRSGASTIAANRGMQLPESLPAPAGPSSVPIPALMLDAAILDDPGPADGLTLDAAIERMMTANLDIRALRHELTQADADVLTAGLRTNPLIYMDTQFIPYGSFTKERPGGPTQYDINITYPLDMSGKRRSRTVVARMARSTLEAQFQDVTRRQIDNVYRAFTNLQSARIDRLSAQAAVRRQEQFLAELERSAPAHQAKLADAADHLVFTLERSRGSLGEAAEAFEDAQEGLGVLLNMTREETARLEPRGGLRDLFPAPPAVEELETVALRCRPDLRAARLGVNRAGAELQLQRANRFDDVYLFYDPFTYQDNRPVGGQAAQSWAVGLTFALPIFNRNQGNIARAESNISQSRLELSSLERRALAEVRLAEREYRRSREALEQLEGSILPRAQAQVRHKTQEFTAGMIDADDYQDHLDTAAEVSQNHRDALVRHRRAMLELNTAVGLRLLP